MFDVKGNPKIIDFGFAIVLPPKLVPKSYSEALSVEWAYRADEFIQASLLDFTHHNPDTLALKIMRSKLAPGKLDAMRRRRAKFVRDRATAAKRSVGGASSVERLAKKTRVTLAPVVKRMDIDWGSASSVKSGGAKGMNIDWGSASTIKKVPAPKRAASKSASGVEAKKARSDAPSVVRGSVVKISNTIPQATKQTKKAPAAPRPIGTWAIGGVTTPQIKQLRVTNLKATLWGLKKSGYEIPAYSKLKKEGLVTLVMNSRAKEPIASGRKTVKQLKIIAKSLGVSGISKMKRSNVVKAISNKRVR
jgi:hypothetical protein